MTTSDLTQHEALDLAWSKLHAVISEEAGCFVVYKMMSDDSGTVSSGGQATVRMKKIELGRGQTRREALANAGAM